MEKERKREREEGVRGGMRNKVSVGETETPTNTGSSLQTRGVICLFT